MRLGLLAALFCVAFADPPAVRFIDIAAESGLTVPNTFGGKDKKDFILESTGTGAAIFDYNGDGANDVFIANGTMLDPHGPRHSLAVVSQRWQGAFHRSGRAGG